MDPRTTKLLTDLTSLPTAAGCEGRVIAYVEAWAKRRRSVTLTRDRFGNLMLFRSRPRNPRKPGKRDARGASPIIFEAHMDHPAFVVHRVEGRRVTASFRGGVKKEFFAGAAVRCNGASGRVVRLLNPDEPMPVMREAGGDLCVVAEFAADIAAAPGDVMTWALDVSEIKDGRLHAPACDNLAGVAAALSAFDAVLRRKSFRGDVRVLLTRAEEIGFIGAMGACRSGIIPKRARLIVLENSKSFADSPVGGGPIVRVGDRTSTFDPDLTYRLSRLAEERAKTDDNFQWQRKLMPGGTCEASAFQAFGYTAACVCLPLGNYHNMNETSGSSGSSGGIDREFIAIADFVGLVALLVEVAKKLDAPDVVPPLRKRLDDLFKRRRSVLG